MSIEFHSSLSSDSLFPERIETERLRLDRFSEQNVPFSEIHSFFSGLDVETEHTVLDPTDNVNETREILLQIEEYWQEGARATYAIRPLDASEDDEIIGISNLVCDWDRMVGDPGICLRKSSWGKGYAGEVAFARNELAFDLLDLEAIEIRCTVDNTKGYELTDRYIDEMNGEYVGVIPNETKIDGERVDCHYFTIRREDYRSR